MPTPTHPRREQSIQECRLAGSRLLGRRDHRYARLLRIFNPGSFFAGRQPDRHPRQRRHRHDRPSHLPLESDRDPGKLHFTRHDAVRFRSPWAASFSRHPRISRPCPRPTPRGRLRVLHLLDLAFLCAVRARQRRHAIQSKALPPLAAPGVLPSCPPVRLPGLQVSRRPLSARGKAFPHADA